MSQENRLDFKHPFPILCGRLYRVANTNRVEPEDKLGYLYLIKSRNPAGWSLSWEEIRSKEANKSYEKDERWEIKIGAGELKIIPGQRSFLLKSGQDAPAFFWYRNESDSNLEKAFAYFTEKFKSLPKAPKLADRFSIPDEESQEQKAKRLEESRILSSLPQFNTQAIISHPEPIASSLKKYNNINYNLQSLVNSPQIKNFLEDTGVVEKLLPLIPAELQSKGKEGIEQVLKSESFQTLLGRLQEGLDQGDMAPLTVSLNLGVNAGRSTSNLLNAIQNKVDQEWEEEKEDS